MSMAAPENLCFYSNNCEWCKAFITELSKTPYKSEFQFVCVDPSPNRPQLPSWLKKVPTLVVKGKSAPLTDNEVQNWIFERKLKDGVKTDVVDNEPSAWLPGEMSCGITSDSYSYMDGSDTLINFEPRGDLVGAPAQKPSEFPLGGRGGQGKTKKEQQFDQDMQNYQKERESGMPQMRARM